MSKRGDGNVEIKISKWEIFKPLKKSKFNKEDMEILDSKVKEGLLKRYSK